MQGKTLPLMIWMQGDPVIVGVGVIDGVSVLVLEGVREGVSEGVKVNTGVNDEVAVEGVTLSSMFHSNDCVALEAFSVKTFELKAV